MATTKFGPPPKLEESRAPIPSRESIPAALREKDRSGPPFIVDGVDPSSDRRLDADERLAWMEKQQDAMRRGQ